MKDRRQHKDANNNFDYKKMYTSIADLLQSVEVTTLIQLVFLNRLMGPGPQTHHNSCVIEDTNMQLLFYSDMKVEYTWSPKKIIYKDILCGQGLSICKYVSPFKKGTNPRIWKGKHFLLACNNRCKCSIETTRISLNVNLGIKIIELVKNLIS